PEEAAILLARLAARPGMRAGDASVGEISRLCGYLPLAIGMLASQLRHHPAWTSAGLAADLAVARDRLAGVPGGDPTAAVPRGPQHHLSGVRGVVPAPRAAASAAAALAGPSIDEPRRDLGELYDQHLLTEHAPGRYQLHDLLREHARALAASDDPAESDAAVGRLLDYHLHTAVAAGTHFGPQASVYRR